MWHTLYLRQRDALLEVIVPVVRLLLGLLQDERHRERLADVAQHRHRRRAFTRAERHRLARVGWDGRRH